MDLVTLGLMACGLIVFVGGVTAALSAGWAVVAVLEACGAKIAPLDDQERRARLIRGCLQHALGAASVAVVLGAAATAVVVAWWDLAEPYRALWSLPTVRINEGAIAQDFLVGIVAGAILAGVPWILAVFVGRGVLRYYDGPSFGLLLGRLGMADASEVAGCIGRAGYRWPRTRGGEKGQ